MDTPFADLHLHTHCSDGALAPSALVEAAADRGLSALAVTDHDTVAAWSAVRRAAAAQGIQVISGIELSVTCDGDEVHLLGYGFDPADPALQRHLKQFRAARRERVQHIIDCLHDEGVVVHMDAVQRAAQPSKSLGRPHVAAALVEGNHVDTYAEAFDRYLGDGKPAHVAKPKFPANQALDMLHAAGGIGVLAHPGHWMSDRLLRTLLRAGLDGIEVVHPSHDDNLVDYYHRIAKAFDLVPTGGSDYHGVRPDADEAFGTRGVSRAIWDRLQACTDGTEPDEVAST